MWYGWGGWGLTTLVEFEWWSGAIPKVLALCLGSGVILQDDDMPGLHQADYGIIHANEHKGG